MVNLLRHYWLVLVITLFIWGIVWLELGFSAFVVTVLLSLLEITLSADNAVVNSRVLVRMSPFWQQLFMTVGILIAVFAVRFALPILLVAVSTSIDVAGVLSMALNHPTEYGKKLHEIAPLIDGFGGMFLFIVALFFFIDSERRHLWVKSFENPLVRIAGVNFIRPLIIIALFVLVELVVPEVDRFVVGVSMIVGIMTYTLLHAVTTIMERMSEKNSLKQQVGWAAFISFMYLQVLDASFSLDGVVGAFALTNNIVIITAGLGVGALWVRTMTVYMVHHNTLVKYKYLESGAHWAIVSLAMIMFLKLLGMELPEIVVGTIGLVFIAGSVISSTRYVKK